MQRKGLTHFIVITFVLSWGLIGVFNLFGGSWNSPGATVVATLYMFMPLLASKIVQKFILKEPYLKDIPLSFRINKWFVTGWLLMPLLAFAAFGIALLFPSVEFSPEMEGMFNKLENFMTADQIEEMRAQKNTMPVHPLWLSLFQGLLAGATINAIAGLGEEAGWRGFMVKELKNFGFWKASLFIGFVWGIWHAPIIMQGHNYPQHPYIGVVMMTIWCILLTPIFLYIRLKSGSVIAAAITHGTLNASFGISIMLIKGGSDLLTGLTGLAGFIALGIVMLIMYFYDTGISSKPILNKTIGQTLSD
jgi:membrane protease YdiL (CAAX protease family)